MAKVYVFLADGFEDIEAIAPIDILRRSGMSVTTVSVNGTDQVTSAHGVTIKADTVIENARLDDADILMLPGGMPGSANLDSHDGVRKALLEQARQGRHIGAICAAPMVLGHLGLLKGRKATCYPGFETELTGAQYTAQTVTVDGNIITGEGPAAAFEYAYRIVELLKDKDTADALRHGMMYAHLMNG